LWEWLTDTVDSISDGIGEAWEWVNDQVDTYIYDTDEDEAWLEKRVNDVVDTYIWDTTNDQAWLEEWVRDTFDDKDKEVKEPINNIYDDINDNFNDNVNDVDDDNKDIWETILEYLRGTGDRISTNVEKTLGYIPDPLEWLLAPILKIIELLTRSSTINLETFIEDGLTIYRLQKELALRIVELEKEVEQS